MQTTASYEKFYKFHFLDEARDVKMSVGVSGNVPRLSISTILNDKLHLEYFREFLNFKDQRLITLHRGTVQNLSGFPGRIGP